ncbi:PRTRC system protein E [Mucilaginibacter rubeus]|uniref:PRTRC system protein E n=2 Tax=Mucilaginibacter rubeus TaxID=2027860 RepID=A0A364WQH2_9SPHI|nr:MULTISPECIES: PRTRC system protein E [Mucilaginibacter]QEM06178.1 PRTRC system protein E [Mucilaginibacter rubeus]QEM13695.1 PRTRC system protein E [Mucilaginibacter rubeus]QEM18760.1 PRTRC system protein E [Mucilaginibacter gossypii]QTE36245.1 PRTRC system protein E [Mucilaginibacter gossypii]QTE44698.1 PRTRC system protein E [Mucilaginibacter rubeus]
MTTNFFQNIASLNLPGTWKLVIQTDADGNMTVSELFNATCGDKAVKLIIPYTLTGTAQDLDEAFFTKITEPVVKTAELQTNLEAHLKSVEQAKAASKLVQDAKAKEAKDAREAKTNTATKNTGDAEIPEPKISKEDKKKAYDEAMSNVTELIKKFKFSEALTILPSVEEHPNKENELKKKRQYLEQQANLYEKALLNYNS